MDNRFSILCAADNRLATPSQVAGDTNSTYPLANLLTLPVSKVWMSSTTAALQISFMASASFSLDALALIGVNFTASATVRLRAGLQSDFSDSAQVLGASVGYVDLVRNHYEERVYTYLRRSKVSVQYLRVDVTDAANSDGFLAIGYALAGQMYRSPYQFVSPFGLERLKEERLAQTEIGYPLIGAALYDSSRVSFEFDALTRLESSSIELALKTLDLHRHPALVCPEAENSEEVFFARLEQMQTITHYTSYRTLSNLSFLTDGLGVLIA